MGIKVYTQIETINLQVSDIELKNQRNGMIIDLCQVCLLIESFQCASDVVYDCYADTLMTTYRSGA